MEGDAPGGRTERTMVVVAMSKEVPGCSCEAVKTERQLWEDQGERQQASGTWAEC